MRKLIKDAVLKYEICNLVRHKKTGILNPSKVKKIGKINKLTIASNIIEAQENSRIMSAIASKHKKAINEVNIKITSIEFGDYEHLSHDVY